MNAQFERLLNVFDAANYQPPEDLPSAIATLPPPGTLPLPWASWTLIALLLYSARVAWAFHVFDSQLRVPEDWQSNDEATQAYNRPWGIVPSHPEWEFWRMGALSALTNRVTGESINVDLINGPRVFTYGSFVEGLLESLRAHGPAETRLLELHPLCRALPLSLDELGRAGLIYEFKERGFNLEDNFESCGFELGHVFDEYEKLVQEFLENWAKDGVRRLWLASQIGDWDAARRSAERLGDAELIHLTGSRATRCHQLRLEDLRAVEADQGLSAALLFASGDANAPDLQRLVCQALHSADDSACAALELIAEDPSHVVSVERLFEKCSGSETLWELSVSCAGYLARHNHKAGEVLRTLYLQPRLCPGEAVVLSLQYTPALARPLIRRALRSENCFTRLAVAAALALFDEAWSRHELIEVLIHSDDHNATEECRAALKESRDPRTRLMAEQWEVANRGHRQNLMLREEGANWGNFGGCDRALAVFMDRFRERLQPLREQIRNVMDGGSES